MSNTQPLADVLPPSARVSTAGHLVIGGCDTVELAERYGTPLYVYDEAAIRAQAASYRDTLAAAYQGASLVCYAAKAYCAPWLLRILADEGLGLDVVSGGELHVALQAGFPAGRIYFHGNNKDEAELRLAVDAGIARVVVDNLEEIERLHRVADAAGRVQPVLLRVTPGVEVHTHQHIKTGVLDTKFGLAIETGGAEEGVRRILERPNLDLLGLHSHIGSQIFDLEAYQLSLLKVLAFAGEMAERHGLRLRELSPGGGFGVAYTPEDDSPATDSITSVIVDTVHSGAGPDLPVLTLEPGRSIVARAAVALYRVGSIKAIPNVRTYVAVDGGMADNIRPTTYDARYSALLANRADEEPGPPVAIAGKYCESGDVLIREADLPQPRVDDLVAVPTSGAYQLAMASNYNLALRPAVVVVRDGQDRLVRRRESFEDLLRNEL